MTLVWRPGFMFDADASTYIEAVEAADEAASPGIGALETNTRYAINNFVIGCKQDGIWSAIKASCILAGARTLDGALVPLVGTAPDNFNFVGIGTDYDRVTGLEGNGTTKHLDSKRADNADDQNDAHVFIHVTESDTRWNTAVGMIYIGAATAGYTSRRTLAPYAGQMYTACQSSVAITGTGLGNAIGGIGASRSSSAGYDIRIAGGNSNRTVTSVTPGSSSIYILAENVNGSTTSRSDARLSFYSIGADLDLALLDNRVAQLMTDLAAAIP